MSAATNAAPAGLRAAEASGRWLREHPEILAQHRGQWLCIVDERLVLAEADWHTFAERVRQYDSCDGCLIFRVPTTEELEVAHPAL